MKENGYTIERLARGGTIKFLRASVRISVGKDGSAAIHGWSLPGTTRRNLGCAVERILLASGVQAYCKPYSTNLLYRVYELAPRILVQQMASENTRIVYTKNVGNENAQMSYPCGSFKSGNESIHFWTGPAVEPESQNLNHYVALGSDAACLEKPSDLLNSLHLNLIEKGAIRIEAQRKLDR